MTEQESNLRLRAQAEGIIKTFQLGPATAPNKAPASPAAARTKQE
jgi:hypothetical protein